MVKRKKETISFSDLEKAKIKAISDKSGETFSGYIRRQIMQIVSEEEEQS